VRIGEDERFNFDTVSLRFMERTLITVNCADTELIYTFKRSVN
jgi:hypothetical protein